MNERVKFVYLLAMPFSGTTLLSRLVALHPEIASIGEMVNIVNKMGGDQYLCSCGMRLGQCSFWLGVKTRMAEKGHHFDLGDFHVTPPQRLISATYRAGMLVSRHPTGHRQIKRLSSNLAVQLSKTNLSRRIEDFSRSVLQQCGKQIFFDASKDPSLLYYLAGNKQLEIIFVHMVRDPRGVSLSMMKNLSKERFSACLSEWVSLNNKIIWLMSLFPEIPSITLKYEDLCESPTLFLNQLFQRLAAQQFTVDLSDEQSSHVIGNRMRLEKLDRIVTGDRWRETINDDDLEEAKNLAGPLAIRLGYFL